MDEINWTRRVGRSFNEAFLNALMKNLSLESADDFLMGVVECFMQVLELDIGGWITKKGEVLKISHLVDDEGRLTDEVHRVGNVFERNDTPEYFAKAWEINFSVVLDPTADIGVDLWIRLTPDIIIFLDGSSEEVQLVNIEEELKMHCGDISRLFQQFIGKKSTN